MARFRWAPFVLLGFAAACDFSWKSAAAEQNPTAASAQTQPDPVEQKFKTLDKNADGVITRDELPNAQLFDRLDANADGKLTLKEALKYSAPTPKTPVNEPPPDAETKPAQDRKRLAEPLRDLDPVVVLGNALPQLIGRVPGKIVAFRHDEVWQQIPVQIDERFQTDLGRILGGKDPLSFSTTVYADANLRTGPDPDANFDIDDELVFMFKDTGSRAEKNDPPGVVAGTRVELRLSEETGKPMRYAYLFVADGGLEPAAGKQYVRYAFKLLKGKPWGNGPNPEDSLISTARYRNHFADRWVHDGTEITAGDASGIDILDRDDFQFRPDVCNRTTATFSQGAGAIIANIDGPVRAVRSMFGCNSGTFAQRDCLCYEGRMTVRTYLRVHPIGSTWFLYDFSPAAQGMTYYDNLNIGGVTIDGKPDDVNTGPLDWQFVTGKQGSLTMAWTLETNIPNVKRSSYYFDDAKPADNQCARDGFAYGASGPATGELPNTDPALRRGGPSYLFQLERDVYYDAPGTSLLQAQGRVTAAWFPPRVEVVKE